MRRITIPSSLVLLFSLMYATPALAAAPLNDTYTGRTVIGGLPYNQTLDTAEATSDADEAALGAECGAPASDAGVWYELTAASDATILIDVSASTYTAGVAVTTGVPGAFGPLEACGPGSVLFAATSGTTYVIMVFDDQLDGAGNGGTLELSVSEAPPPPEVDVTIDPIGHFDSKTGTVTLTGTIACDDGAFASLDASVRQPVGRFVVSGYGFTEVACDGTAQSWSMEVFGESGQFKGGTADAVVFGWACTFDCGFDMQEASIRLRR